MIQQRAIFVLAVFPLVTGIVTAATQHIGFRERQGGFLLMALAAAAVCIWSPNDPRIPPGEHLAIFLFVFMIPLSLVLAFSRGRAAVLERYGKRDSSPAVALLASVNFLVLLFASLGLGVGLGLVHLDRLVIRVTENAVMVLPPPWGLA